jgi:hypothetical protein
MPELWSVFANEEACDLVMRAPGAGRVAADEVMVRGPIAGDLRAAIHTVDPDALIREATEGWVEVVIDGADARDVFASVSELLLPDGPGYAQGDVARVGARVYVEDDEIRVLVPASWASHIRGRIDDAGPSR